jgi:hypothetical protein
MDSDLVVFMDLDQVFICLDLPGFHRHGLIIATPASDHPVIANEHGFSQGWTHEFFKEQWFFNLFSILYAHPGRRVGKKMDFFKNQHIH